jgi:hypothetical protein
MSHSMNTTLFGPGFDYELRTYQLLALEKQSAAKIKQSEIFPSLTQLLQWYHAASEFIEMKKDFENSLRSTLTQLDVHKGKLNYTRPCVETIELFDEMYKLATETLQKTQGLIHDFEDLKNRLIQQIESAPVGILPLYRDEGYLLITHATGTDVFKYQRKMVFDTVNSSRHISSDYFSTYEVSILNTPEKIKLNLIKNYSEIPNPATWSFYCDHQLPLDGTLLPLAKEKLNGMIDG